MNLINKVFVILICTQIIGLAHGNENNPDEKFDTMYVVNGDTIAINGIPTEKILSKNSLKIR